MQQDSPDEWLELFPFTVLDNFIGPKWICRLNCMDISPHDASSEQMDYLAQLHG